jgi:hypothetical protein
MLAYQARKELSIIKLNQDYLHMTVWAYLEDVKRVPSLKATSPVEC